MRRPKLFLFIITVVSLLLLLSDFGRFVGFPDKSFTIPFLGYSLNPKNLISSLSVIDVNIFGLPIKRELSYRLGLDLQGGVRLTYDLDMKGIADTERASAFESSRNILDQRINYLGVSEPNIQNVVNRDNYRVVVELPGLTDVSSAQNLIGRTAQLTFWEVGEKEATQSAVIVEELPLGMIQVTEGKQPIKTKLTGKGIKKAQVVYDPTTGTPEVQIDFTNAGTTLFADITKRNVKKIIIIVLDNELLSWPVVQQVILNGSTVIQGQFSLEQAKNLATLLNAGALPVPLKLVAQTQIGPSLGIESLKKSLFAGAIGLFSVIIFMIVLYRKEGALAGLALLVYALLTLFIFKLIPVTLTLAGIAGFILSIGMAIDANILIFERMKEERRAGRARGLAVEIGFKRAWSSIRDSNITSLITCSILFYFGSGIVRGFALTLAIGILVSMFSAIVVTRNLLRVFDK